MYNLEGFYTALFSFVAFFNDCQSLSIDFEKGSNRKIVQALEDRKLASEHALNLLVIEIKEGK
jgi:hypothetical protein